LAAAGEALQSEQSGERIDQVPPEDQGSAIVASGAAFWTIAAVDSLKGSVSSHSTPPAYTAGNDISSGSLTASHLDDHQSLGVLIGPR
jgi:hypothetical protein